MPWNQNGGGWKSGSGGPWGHGPSGGSGGSGGGPQPDLEEILKRSQDRLKQAMPGGIGSAGFMVIFLGIVAAVAYFGFTVRINADQVGVVQRFGKLDRQLPPGLNFRLPYPVEQVSVVNFTTLNREEIGLRAAMPSSFGGTQPARDVPEESLMLTGDENIVDVDFNVFWRVKDAANFLFNVQNPDATVKAAAESAMREVIGQNEIQPILTRSRQEIEEKVKSLLQATLDSYQAGITITQINLQKVDPPTQVIDAFRDVQAARADQERLQNEAQAYANRVVPEARGDAQRILQAAQGYREQAVAEATGRTQRFLQIYEEYAKAPDVTRKRMFLETMERVLGGMDKVIIDDKSQQGVVPYLPLNELAKPRNTQTQAGGQQ